MGWNGGNKVQVLTENDFSVAVTHQFVRESASAETYEAVYNAFVNVLSKALQIDEISVFEVVAKEKKLYRCSRTSSGAPTNAQAIAFGKGLVGHVAKRQISILISDSSLQNDYKLGQGLYSALCIPVQFNGELFGVICSFHPVPGFFNDEHRRLYELIAEIAASLLARIRQKIELNHLKITLEKLLEDKKAALHIAVETVSNQFSELKFQRDKREILLREVHHRVNNNLQIISSLVSLYLSETKEPDHKTLREIQSRIQILSSIHLILLKSLELNEISLNGFLEDLTASLRYNSSGNYLVLKFSTKGIKAPFSFNTLIPMGMLIHELVQLAAHKFWEEGTTAEMHLHISKEADSSLVHLEMLGKNYGDYRNGSLQNENVQQTIIHALCEQLEGNLIEMNPEACKWRFTFKEI